MYNIVNSLPSPIQVNGDTASTSGDTQRQTLTPKSMQKVELSMALALDCVEIKVESMRSAIAFVSFLIRRIGVHDYS